LTGSGLSDLSDESDWSELVQVRSGLADVRESAPISADNLSPVRNTGYTTGVEEAVRKGLGHAGTRGIL